MDEKGIEKLLCNDDPSDTDGDFDDSNADPDFTYEVGSNTEMSSDEDRRMVQLAKKKGRMEKRKKGKMDERKMNERCANNRCASRNCKEEIFAACFRCLNFLCFKHFDESQECHLHSGNFTKREEQDREKIVDKEDQSKDQEEQKENQPEDFPMEGSRREGDRPQGKTRRINLIKEKKDLRNSGKSYTQHKSFNLVAPRTIKNRCNGPACERFNRKCSLFTDENRKEIFDAYWGLKDLTLQREYLARFAKRETKKRTMTDNPDSRRQNTIQYSLPLNGKKETVCKVFFLNTMGITDKMLRTTLEKIQETGIITKDKRGGRSKTQIETDKRLREAIQKHINKYDRVESHYMRSNTSKEFLHADLNVSKMYRMYLEENSKNQTASLRTYLNVFKSMNLSFHRAKKDQCSLCMTYRQGDSKVKDKLQEQFNSHTSEKNKVRQIKETLKKVAMQNKKHVVAVFDLQQVIYLPKSNEGAIFYKRRFANFNFTMYNLTTKDCHCYFWHEAISKRGACEISSCVFQFLTLYAQNGVTHFDLFSDGCAGQNKNTIVVAMLIWAVMKLPIQEISLRYFETNHGQNEGDSAHSAISYAIDHAGDLFLPSQIVPIIRLARSSKPYIVKQLETSDVYDFKEVSKTLRILNERKDNETGSTINWTEVKEVRVKKDCPGKIEFKTSHNSQSYRSISLQRMSDKSFNKDLKNLNKEPPKVPVAKYKDLILLTEGPNPVIRFDEHKIFYRTLPH